MNHRGFTLTELITVIVILGVLAVAIIPRMNTMSVFQQRADYDRVFSALEYARKAAVAQRRYVCVAVAANNLTFTVNPLAPESTSFAGACTAAPAGGLPLPATDSGCASYQTCVTAITLSGSSSPFKFDALGRASAPVTVTLNNIADSGTTTITIEGDTGYVH